MFIFYQSIKITGYSKIESYIFDSVNTLHCIYIHKPLIKKAYLSKQSVLFPSVLHLNSLSSEHDYLKKCFQPWHFCEVLYLNTRMCLLYQTVTSLI